jgi:outer membrane protein TolC
MIKRLLPLLAFATAFRAFAADPAAQPAADTAAPAAAPAVRSVTLHDLLVEALNTNLELRAKRIDPLIQANRLTAAWGAFDPNWISGYTFSSTERPQPASASSIFSPSTIYQEDVQHFETGLTGRLPTGTQYQLITSSDRAENTYNRASSSRYFPEYISTSSLTLIQPLLRDFGTSANLAEVRLQKSAQKAATYDLEATVLRIMRDVSTAYFEMVFAQENIRVKRRP